MKMKIKGGGGGVLQPFYFWWRRKILARELTLTTAQAFFFKILHTLHELVWSLVWKIFLDPNFSFTFTQNKICVSFLRTLSLSLGAGLLKTQDRAWSWSHIPRPILLLALADADYNSNRHLCWRFHKLIFH